ncbi:MAG: glycosyltransferase [Bacilli bacterium]|jgi:glycosyltransferase involved in cell wall biosynthesis
MKIIYLTTSMLPEDFEALSAKCNPKPNPSNQNFHRHLISLLAKDHRIDVISIRPVAPGMTREKHFPSYTKHNYHYVGFYNSKIRRRISLFHQLRKTIMKILELNGLNTLLIVDGLSYLLTRVALEFKKTYRLPILGIYTDNPNNLTGVSQKYIKKLEKTYADIDLYFSISPALNLYVNPNGKPSLIYEGLSVPLKAINPRIPEEYGRYFFFAGALLEKYGLRMMIDGFLESHVKDKLLIAGHGKGADIVLEANRRNNRVIYLGLLTENEVANFATHSLASLNPRPLDSKRDLQSFPSKVLQYLSMGTPVISTKHPRLYDLFKDEVLWLKDADATSIKRMLQKVSRDPYHYQVQAKRAQTKTQEIFGIEPTRQKVNNFLNKNVRF